MAGVPESPRPPGPRWFEDRPFLHMGPCPGLLQLNPIDHWRLLSVPEWQAGSCARFPSPRLLSFVTWGPRGRLGLLFSCNSPSRGLHFRSSLGMPMLFSSVLKDLSVGDCRVQGGPLMLGVLGCCRDCKGGVRVLLVRQA